LGALVRDLGLSEPKVWTGPRRRAIQTAAAVSRALRLPAAAERPEVAPDAPVKPLAAMVTAALNECEHLVVVGHQPQLGRLIEELAGVPDGALELPPGVLLVLHLRGDLCGEGPAFRVGLMMAPPYPGRLGGPSDDGKLVGAVG
jgi:phosphohistidine phosphatase SixA